MAEHWFFSSTSGGVYDSRERDKQRKTPNMDRNQDQEEEGKATVKEVITQVFSIIQGCLKTIMTSNTPKEEKEDLMYFLVNAFRLEDSLFKKISTMIDNLCGIPERKYNEKEVDTEKDRFSMPRASEDKKFWDNPLFARLQIEQILVELFEIAINEEKNPDFMARRQQVSEKIRAFVEEGERLFRFPEETSRPPIVGSKGPDRDENIQRYFEATNQVEQDLLARGLTLEDFIGEIDERHDRVSIDWTTESVRRAGQLSTRYGGQFAKTYDGNARHVTLREQFVLEAESEETGNSWLKLSSNLMFRIAEEGEEETDPEEVMKFLEQTAMLKDKSGTLSNLPEEVNLGEFSFMSKLTEEDLVRVQSAEGMPTRELLEKTVTIKKPEDISFPISKIGDIGDLTLPREEAIRKYVAERDPTLSREETVKKYLTSRGKSKLFSLKVVKNGLMLKKRSDEGLEIIADTLGAKKIRIHYVRQDFAEADKAKWQNIVHAKLSTESKGETEAQMMLIHSNLAFMQKKVSRDSTEPRTKDGVSVFEGKSEGGSLVVTRLDDVCVGEKSKKCIQNLCMKTCKKEEKCTRVYEMDLEEGTTIYDIKEVFSSTYVAPSGKSPEVRIVTKKGEPIYMVYIPFNPLTKSNVQTVMRDLKLQSTWDKMLRKDGPFCYGAGDSDHYVTRLTDIESAARHTIEAWIVPLVGYSESNAVGVGLGDPRTCIPRPFCLCQCNWCLIWFESTVTLLLHLIYEEDALDLLKEDKDHTWCDIFSRCHCRLSKDPENRNEDFNWERQRPVPIYCIAFTDLTTMTLKEAQEVIIVLAMLEVPAYLPGSAHGKMEKMAFSRVPMKQNAWSESIVPVGMYINRHGVPKVKDNFVLPIFSSTRLDHKGYIVDLTVQHLLSDTFDRGLNKCNSFEKMPSLFCQPLKFVSNVKTTATCPLKFIVDTGMASMKGLVAVNEEVYAKNIFKYCTGPTTEGESKRKFDTARFMMEVSLAIATVVPGRTYYNNLKRMMPDFAVNETESMNPMKIWSTGPEEGLVTKEDMERKVVDFGTDPNTGREWIENHPFSMPLEKMGISKPFNRLLDWMKTAGDKLETAWPSKLNPKVPKRYSYQAQRVIKPVPNLSSFVVEQNHTYSTEKAEETRKRIAKVKKTSKQVKIQEFVCETCKKILEIGGKKPNNHRRGCFQELPPKEQNKIYSRWLREEASAATATDENNVEDESASETEAELLEVVEDAVEEIIENTEAVEDTVEEVAENVETAEEVIEEDAENASADVNNNVQIGDIPNYVDIRMLEPLVMKTNSADENIKKEDSDEDSSFL